MLKEIKYFVNDVGSATVYDESGHGYTIEQRIQKEPWSCRCRTWAVSDIDAAMKRFNRVKGLLCAMQTRRENKK